MKVVHLLAELRPSGMERMLVSAAPYFQEAGVSSVVVGAGENHPFAQDLEAAGYRLRFIDSVKTYRGLRNWMAILREEDPDVVHVHSERAFAATVLAAHLAAPQARIVRTLHSFFLARGWWGIKRQLQARLSDRFVDTTVCLSDAMAEHERIFGRHCEIISNWVEDDFLKDGVWRPTIDIALVGNCSEVKNHEVVLQAALAKRWSVCHFGHEAGASPRELALLESMEEQGLLPFRGIGDPQAWLRRTRVFAMPSVREGFPVALAEAIAVGLRCVASEISGHEWARAYPLVTLVPLNDVDAWTEAFADALTQSQTESESHARDEQRSLAANSLSARRGVEAYLRIYRQSQHAGTAGS